MSATHVLVVDDEPLICWSLKEALSEDGCVVTVAGDGEAAMRELARAPHRPNVVLLDYLLPDSNGLSLCKTITDRVRPGRVILMTAYGTPEVRRGALDLGAYDVVIKPFDVKDIAAIIRRAHTSSASQSLPESRQSAPQD